jgi:uncharacterized protein
MKTMRWVRSVSLAAALCIGVVPGVGAQDFAAGLSAYTVGDFGRAMSIWRPLAEQGDARSQSGLGFLLFRGLGTPSDPLEARVWYEKAAAQGQAEAQLMLGIMYYFGNGVQRSFVWAFAWCQMAFVNGNPEASFCRDASIESMTDPAQLTESFNLAQQLLSRQEAAKR